MDSIEYTVEQDCSCTVLGGGGKLCRLCAHLPLCLPQYVPWSCAVLMVTGVDGQIATCTCCGSVLVCRNSLSGCLLLQSPSRRTATTQLELWRVCVLCDSHAYCWLTGPCVRLPVAEWC